MKTASRFEPARRTVEEIAPAKVNLILSVGKKREDGYHDLLTLMETVSLCDKLTFQVENEILPEIKLSICGKYPVPEDPSNLVIRAAEAFFARIGRRFSLSVRLEKNIPTEAGLGGGSADAAATLRALNRIAGDPISSDELRDLAATLGADVPFCLFGGTSICRGIGEIMETIDRPARRFYAVVMGKDHVSTSGAYRALDEYRANNADDIQIPSETELHTLAAGGNVPLANDFEAAVFPDRPAIAERKARLLSLGAKDALTRL